MTAYDLMLDDRIEFLDPYNGRRIRGRVFKIEKGRENGVTIQSDRGEKIFVPWDSCYQFRLLVRAIHLQVGDRVKFSNPYNGVRMKGCVSKIQEDPLDGVTIQRDSNGIVFIPWTEDISAYHFHRLLRAKELRIGNKVEVSTQKDDIIFNGEVCGFSNSREHGVLLQNDWIGKVFIPELEFSNWDFCLL